jgi:hypothetical protein
MFWFSVAWIGISLVLILVDRGGVLTLALSLGCGAGSALYLVAHSAPFPRRLTLSLLATVVVAVAAWFGGQNI